MSLTQLTVNHLDYRPDPHSFCLSVSLFFLTLNLQHRSDHTIRPSFNVEALRKLLEKLSFPPFLLPYGSFFFCSLVPVMCIFYIRYILSSSLLTGFRGELVIFKKLHLSTGRLSLYCLNICTKIQLSASAFSYNVSTSVSRQFKMLAEGCISFILSSSAA